MRKTKIIALLWSCFLLDATGTFAKEGMWLPPTVKSRESDMQAMGLEIPAEMLYNNNGTGLNNAVVLFGRGCTGEIISSKGLLLTNHHCGYGTVQGLSSPAKDYFAAGFWAMNPSQELPCPGLTVTFIRKMENVTNMILKGVEDTLNDTDRDTLVARRIRIIEKHYAGQTPYDVKVRSYFNDNQYWLQFTETFKDIRLVGFPPNGIGSFGGDTDNWMWPRHTGDFSIFRIYASPDNRPADYAPGNKPYQTKDFFTINANGYKEGDFTMVYGFPGTTQEYISSYQLQQIYDIQDPIRIDARTKKLDIWTENMSRDREVFIKYTSKRAGVANGWKKWQGELRGLKINNVVAKKQEQEQAFQIWANRNTDNIAFANGLLAHIQALTASTNEALRAEEYIREALYGVEILQQAALLDRIKKAIDTGGSLDKLQKDWADFNKNYDMRTDKRLFETLVPLFLEKCPEWMPAAFKGMYLQQGNSIEKLSNYVYGKALMAQASKMDALFKGTPGSNTISSDPAYQIYKAVQALRNEKITPKITHYNAYMKRLNRLYMQAQMLREPNRTFYPDANLTLRLTYGKVEGIQPEGSSKYSYQTNLDQAILKDNPNVEEFRMPQRLKEVYHAKDYGRWQQNGTVPLAFIASNHTSGGNSGSPVLNSKGELIGTNFDRIWEGTMSDLYFDPRLCRNISVDIRYTLFIVEKVGGAGWLLNELKLAPAPGTKVKAKTKK